MSGSFSKKDSQLSYSAIGLGPVHYLPVELDGVVIGYVFSGVHRGASFLRVLSAQDNISGVKAAMVWNERLEDGDAKRLSAEEALQRWIGAEEHPVAGAIPPGAEFAEAGSEEELGQMANPGHIEPPLPPAPEPRYFVDGTPMDRAEGFGPLNPRPGYGPTYPLRTNSPIRYLPVYRGELLLGYLWAAETNDAAGFAPRLKTRIDGQRALGRWITRMEESKSAGATPLAILRNWKGAEEDPIAGAIPADAEERHATDSDALEIYARD